MRIARLCLIPQAARKVDSGIVISPSKTIRKKKALATVRNPHTRDQPALARRKRSVTDLMNVVCDGCQANRSMDMSVCARRMTLNELTSPLPRVEDAVPA